MVFLPLFLAGEKPADRLSSTLPKKGSGSVSLRSWGRNKMRTVIPAAPTPRRESWQWPCWLSSTDLRPRRDQKLPGASAWASWWEQWTWAAKVQGLLPGGTPLGPMAPWGCCGDED